MSPANPPWLRVGEGFVTVEIVARPGSPRHGLLRVEDRGLVVGLASPAERGKANEELIDAVARLAQTARSNVSIIRGTGSRCKVVRIVSANSESLAGKLTELSLKS